MTPETLAHNVKQLIDYHREIMQPPDYLCMDPATFSMILPPEKYFTAESPASGINMNGDAFYQGIKVIFVQKAGVQLGYHHPDGIK